MKRKRPTEDEDRPSTSTAENDSTRPRCTEDPSPELVDRQDSDLDDSDGDLWKDLHQAIQKGDVEYVRRVLQIDSGGQHFSYEGTSALYLAFSCEQYDIASFLIHRGAKVHSSEFYDLYDLDIDLKRLNYLLLDYNRKSEKSCIYQLTSWSQCPQGLEGDRLRAVMRLYEEFYESPILRLLMKVLEKEPFDIVYDFESELVDRTHRLYPVESEIYGLTLSNSREIFVGAKTLLCGGSRKRAKVYGVVAEEMCHLALTILFQNDAKPYREEDSELRREFQEIVNAVKEALRSSFSRACHVEKVIKDVYENYEYPAWECELIARVPHVVGLHGEELGRIVMESPELSRLFEFYKLNVHPRCEEYTQTSLNTKAHRLMEQALRKNDYISFEEKQVQPLKEGFPSFRKSLVDVGGISVIATNCEKLCTLQIYHELKREHGDALEKKCIFLTRKSFEKKRERILDALNGRVWEYLILVLDEKDLKLRRLTCEYADEFEEFKRGAMKIVIISPSQSLGPKFEKKTVKYKWNDLSEDFKTIQSRVEYRFNGEREIEYIAKECFLKLFSEEEILSIISGTVIEVCDGNRLYSQGYTPETYICREFQMMTVDLQFFKHLPSNSCVFLSNFSKSDFRDLSIDDKLVQWFSGPDDRILQDKSIFIDNIGSPMSFQEFVRRNQGKTNIWVHHDKQAFYLRNNDLSRDAFQQYVKKITMNEKEMLKYLERNKTVIISDNAGCGKSTVISSLIRSAKENLHGSWVWRINFNEFCMGKKDHRGKENALSLANINPDSDEEDVLDYFYLIIGLRNGFEKYLFKRCSGYGKCIVFLDGFDEIPSKYANSALRLLSILRRKTAANIIITTRKHHQAALEEQLNTTSHQLVAVSEKGQLMYLDKFWKDKLKHSEREGNQVSDTDQKAIEEKITDIIQESKRREAVLEPEYRNIIHALEEIDCGNDIDSVRSQIDELDFKKFAQVVLHKTALNDRILEFMGIPLHLFMIGNILYNGNLNVDLEFDVFHLYSIFVEQKILIYIEEKEGILKEGKLKEGIVERMRRDVYRIHMDLALQLMDKGEACLASEWKPIDQDLCSSLGIVFIHNERIQFLHQTFAEFFLAEFTRKAAKEHQRKRKEVLLKIISESDCKVVRIFLSSALKKDNFENIDKEFFKDSDFLINLMEYNDFFYYGRRMMSTNDNFRTCSIIKKLLGKFEAVDVTKDLVNEFIEKVHIRVLSESKNRRLLSSIGVCVTLYMLKNLLARDLKVYSESILTFVRVSDNAEEVIDLLKKYFDLKTAKGFSGSSKRVNCGDEKRDAAGDGILDLLSLTDPNGDGMILITLCKESVAIFASILKFFKEELEDEKLMATIVDSSEYGKQVRKFIKNEPYRIWSTLKALHSVFGNETKNLFGRDSKRLMFDCALVHEKASKKTDWLKLVIGLFVECFGREEVKELLVNEVSDGEYITHKVIWFKGRVVEYLNQINDVLEDRDQMFQLFRRKNRHSKGAFHSAAEKGLCFDEILTFCETNFEKDLIKDLLLDVDESSNDVINSLLLDNTPEISLKNLKLIKETVCDDLWLRELLKGKIVLLNDVCHAAFTGSGVILEDFLTFCAATFEMEQVKEMLISIEYDKKMSVLPSLAENLIYNLEIINKFVGDNEWFKHFLVSVDRLCRKALLSYAVHRIQHRMGSRPFYEDNLSEDEFRGTSTHECLYSVIHLLVSQNFNETLERNLKLINELIGDAESFRNVLKQKGICDMNLFHFVAVNRQELKLSLFDLYLSEGDAAELLMQRDKFGRRCLHYISNPGNLSAFLDYAERKISGVSFEDFVLGTDVYGDTILHSLVKRRYALKFLHKIGEFLNVLKEKLSDEQLKRLWWTRNVKGEKFM